MTTPAPTDLRRFLARLAWFLVPAAAVLVGEQIAMIRGWLTFRVWEQLVVLPAAMHPGPPFPGPFYPRQTVARTEQGDLGFHTRFAAHRQVSWKTDRYGYRNQDTAAPPSVVIVGDSMIAGSSLDQSEILSTLLAGELGVAVVNLAPAEVPAIFSQTRFFDHRPKLVLQGMAERRLQATRGCNEQPPAPENEVDDGILQWLAEWWWVTRDRQLKQPFLLWADSRLHASRIDSVVGRDQRTLFHRGDGAHDAIPAMLDQGARNLARCGNLLAGNGIPYLPFLIPDKETIYWELLPSGTKPASYRRALDGLANVRLPVVDLEAVFSAERQRGAEPLYPPDESHWSAPAVALTSRVLAQEIRKRGLLEPGVAPAGRR